MHVYVYKAALYCENCGAAIRHRLTDAGKAPDNPYDEASYDSNDFPKGPFDSRTLESDAPHHCDACGVYLEYNLTPDGIAYIVNRLRNGSPDDAVLQEWAEHVNRYDLTDEQQAIVNRYLIR